MVKLDKIYTRGGDAGETSLGDGSRILKYDVRVEAYGTVDEVNAHLGVARLYCEGETDAMIGRIQNDLFDLGADLCIPDNDKNSDSLRIVSSYIKGLEENIDLLNKDLNPLRSFILPGGSKVSSYLHIARTIARRSEREMVELNQVDNEHISKESIQYINRLSDFLFVAARYVNLKLNFDDILWVPGDNYEK